MANKNIIDVATNLNPFEVSLDAQAFDDLIQAHGVKFRHWLAVPCPGSTSERSSNRSKHQGHTCTNGFYYQGGKCFTGVLNTNSSGKNNRPEGMLDVSPAVILLPRYYDTPDSSDVPDQMYFCAFDRIDLADDTCATWVSYFEIIEASQTGTDRARFPIKKVISLIDANNKIYSVGIDFEIFNGAIRWITQNRPHYDMGNHVGQPYSVRYLYSPCFYVQKNLHEIRILNTLDPITGEKKQVRFPMQLQVIREVDYLSDDRDAFQNDTAREGTAPPSGGNFGPS